MNTSTLVYDYSIFIRSESALILFTNFELALFVPRLKTIYILWDILIHKFKCAFQNNHSFIEENFKPQWFHVNPFGISSCLCTCEIFCVDFIGKFWIYRLRDYSWNASNNSVPPSSISLELLMHCKTYLLLLLFEIRPPHKHTVVKRISILLVWNSVPLFRPLKWLESVVA